MRGAMATSRLGSGPCKHGRHGDRESGKSRTIPVSNELKHCVVSHVGRGTRLGRGACVRAWPVFEESRAQLAKYGLKEVDDAYRHAAALLAEGGAGNGYAAVVDVAQGFTALRPTPD